MKFGKKRAVRTVETWIIGGVLKKRSARLTNLPKVSSRATLRMRMDIGVTAHAARMDMTPAVALAA